MKELKKRQPDAYQLFLDESSAKMLKNMTDEISWFEMNMSIFP